MPFAQSASQLFAGSHLAGVSSIPSFSFLLSRRRRALASSCSLGRSFLGRPSVRPSFRPSSVGKWVSSTRRYLGLLRGGRPPRRVASSAPTVCLMRSGREGGGWVCLRVCGGGGREARREGGRRRGSTRLDCLTILRSRSRSFVRSFVRSHVCKARISVA